MPTTALKINPGVNVEMTPALNEAGWATSQFIRFRQGMVEKTGGWQRFIPGVSGSAAPILAIKSWEGLNADFWLSAGTTSSLVAINAGVTFDIAPYTLTLNNGPSFSTVSGSATVTVIDAASNTAVGDTVNISVPVAIGGLVLSGLYSVASVIDANTYTITAAANATATASGGAVPSFSTVNGSHLVTVTLTNHGLAVGGTFYVTVPTVVGGITVSGVYTVYAVTSANAFTFYSNALSVFTDSKPENTGNMRNVYYYVATPGRSLVGTPAPATDWTLDNFGARLIGCIPGGPIYVWDPYGSTGTRAQVIPNAPLANDGIIISPSSQMVIAWGTTYGQLEDPMLIRWCDASNYNAWAATVTNLAGSLRVPTGSRIVAIVPQANGMLVFTDIDLYLMSYVGGQFIYGLNKIAGNCGLVSRHAACTLNASTYWASASAFYTYSPTNGVQEVPCTVWDAVFQNLYPNSPAFTACANSGFSEILWFYPSAASSGGINDSYVRYNADENCWDLGLLTRTAWTDRSILGGPIAGDQNGILWQHSTGFDNGTAPMLASATTGYFAIQEGTNVALVDRIIPDFKYTQYAGGASAALAITFFGKDHADGPVTTYGPYAVTSTTLWIDVRIRNRLLAIQISSSDLGTWWRLGNVRYRFQQSGKR